MPFSSEKKPSMRFIRNAREGFFTRQKGVVLKC